MLRRCYKTKARVFINDTSIETDVIWQWCRTDAKPLPINHAFGSGVFDRVHGVDNHNVGEIRGAKIEYVDGNLFNKLPGKCCMGTQQQWSFGIKPSDPVLARPDCCSAKFYSFVASGGLRATGTFISKENPTVISTGNAFFGGSSPATLTLFHRSTGTLNLQPDAIGQLELAHLNNGSVGLGNACNASLRLLNAPFGSISLSGVVNASVSLSKQATGGLGFGSSASVTTSIWSGPSVASSASASNVTGQVTMNVPSGTVPGNMLISTYVTTLNGGTINLPSGWSTITTVPFRGGAAQLMIGVRIVVAGDPSTFVTTGTGSPKTNASVLRLTAASSIGATVSATGSGPIAVAPSITTTAINSLLLAIWATDTTMDTITPDPTYDSEYLITNTAGSFAMATEEAPFIATYSATPANLVTSSTWVARQIEIKQ